MVNIIQAVLYEAVEMFLFPSGERSKQFIFLKNFVGISLFKISQDVKGKYIVYLKYKNCRQTVEISIDHLM